MLALPLKIKQSILLLYFREFHIPNGNLFQYIFPVFIYFYICICRYLTIPPNACKLSSYRSHQEDGDVISQHGNFVSFVSTLFNLSVWAVGLKGRGEGTFKEGCKKHHNQRGNALDPGGNVTLISTCSLLHQAGVHSCFDE